MRAAQVAKAIGGAIAAGATAIGTALADGQITGPEWCLVVTGVLAGFGIVYQAPKNQDS